MTALHRLLERELNASRDEWSSELAACDVGSCPVICESVDGARASSESERSLSEVPDGNGPGLGGA